ncbi:MAG: type VI secretion system baseplate subunit TssE [Gammaproteobacteria bacterium]|jgi:type VI secretion system protein ImpF
MIKTEGTKRQGRTVNYPDKAGGIRARTYGSLLDRLSLSNTDQQSGDRKPIDLLKNSIRLDLENVLNTRLKRQVSIEHFPELDVSILNYGLPDFSKVRFDDEAQRNAFAERICWVIETFEPRLSSVNVQVLPVDDQFERILNLRITAVLHISNESLPVVLQSQVKSFDRYVTFHEVSYG